MTSNNSPVEAVALAIRLQATREVLALIAKGSGTDREAGRKALLLSYVMDKSIIGSQRELARRMGVSEARASQMLKSFRTRLTRKGGLSLQGS